MGRDPFLACKVSVTRLIVSIDAVFGACMLANSYLISDVFVSLFMVCSCHFQRCGQHAR